MCLYYILYSHLTLHVKYIIYLTTIFNIIFNMFKTLHHPSSTGMYYSYYYLMCIRTMFTSIWTFTYYNIGIYSIPSYYLICYIYIYTSISIYSLPTNILQCPELQRGDAIY